MQKPFYYYICMAHLWKRPSNGIYYVVWMEEGKQHKKSLGTTEKRIATRLFNNFRRDLAAGKVKPIASGIRETLYPFVDEFLDYISATKESATYTLYKVALEKAKSSWGDIPLLHITPRHIDTLMTDMVRSGLKIPTINKNFRHVKAALRKAYEWAYIKNPIKFSKQIKEEEKVRYLNSGDLVLLISKMNDPEFADLCLFSAYTGLRSGEILRLNWGDIDEPLGFLRISAKQKNKEESWIPINANTKAILDRCKKRQGVKPFRFRTRTWISQKFKKYARKAGLAGCRFHDLRHTYGSHLAMTGENEVAIQKLMRHKSIQSTLIYTNVSPEYLRKVSNKVNYGPMPLPKEEN